MTLPVDWIWRGRAHVIGDGVPLDGGVIPLELVLARITDPVTLAPRVLEDLRPGFAAQVLPDDVLLAGRQFGRGKPHPQGLIGLAALGVLVLCESAPYGVWRGAVARALPLIRDIGGCTSLAEEGDRLEVDAAAGEFHNVTRATRRTIPAIPLQIRTMISEGGLHGAIRAAIAERRPA